MKTKKLPKKLKPTANAPTLAALNIGREYRSSEITGAGWVAQR